MEFSDAESLIGDLAFPIAISLYCLTRLDKLLRSLIERVDDLCDELKRSNGSH